MMCACCCVAISSLRAADAPSRPLSPSATPHVASPQQDDATLRDVCFVGRTGYAVGDHAAVWKSTDGGGTWSFVAVPADLQDVSWHSVCFLTDRVGWLAGGRVRVKQHAHEGVLCYTQDGGLNWERLAAPLPYLKHVQFFDLEAGVAISEPSRRFPSGVMQSNDGGRTWTACGATRTVPWTTGAFLSPDAGVLIGKLGERGIVSRGSVLPPNVPASGLKNHHAVSADPAGRCWTVGDGAMLMTSPNAGVSWEPPQESLPTELADYVNLLAVDHRGSHVWVAGSPGAVLWHSPDDGRSWQPQPTGDAAPLHAIHFRSETEGCAVGTFGRICITNDGGATWTCVRGQDRRLALWSLQTDPQQTSVPLFARYAAEEGYRSAVTLFSRRDIGPDAHVTQSYETEFPAVLQAVGVNELQQGWRLPLAIPGIAQNRERLLEDWSLLTDRRFAEVVMSELVAQIRMWRPSVIIVDEPVANDAASTLLLQAAQTAISAAADPQAFPGHSQHAGLAPWQAQKLLTRRAGVDAGTIQVDPFELLPRTQQTVGDAAQAAAGRSALQFTNMTAPQHFNVVFAQQQLEQPRRTIVGDLQLSSGSAARRVQLPLSETDFDQLIAQIRQRRTISNLVQATTSRPERAGVLLAQLDGLTESLPPEIAAAELAKVARAYWHGGQWSLAEETYGRLLDRYPNTPAAVEAMTWLVEVWTSSELNWQRLRKIGGSEATRQARTRGEVESELQQALQIAGEDQTDTARQMRLRELLIKQQLQVERQGVIPTSGNIQSVLNSTNPDAANGAGESATQHSMQLRRWLDMAAALTGELEQQHPLVFEQPELQFVVASLHRRRSKHQQADAIYDSFLKSLSDDPWHIAARGEAWLLRPGAISPKPVLTVNRAAKPPVLDGLLSDPCWNSAADISLSETPASADEGFVDGDQADRKQRHLGPRPLVMMCRDEEYLYLAASVPRERQLPDDLPKLPGRSHDADLSGFDQLVFQFDVDRDYATW
ncbi:MAG: hypothetical protein KDA58_13130, partial [Planctomycetaceae bacterium]|nr:hypothetical protein [Planctomycetaceae bacterium]